MSETDKTQAANQLRLPKAKDGALLLPSVFKQADGKPRFALPIPPALLQDGAIRFLVEREMRFGGFEYPTRAFFDAHLEPDDLFIDVGAHWGVMALHAATRHRGAVKVLAIEAHPLNVGQLMRAVVSNGLQDSMTVVAAAAGDRPGTAPLVANTTMGHSLHGLGLQGIARSGGFHLSVPVVTIDDLLAERPELEGRRTIIKIDVEGFEPQVVAGAEKLLASGRVAALVWEKGRAFDQEPARSAMLKMIAHLEALGFSQHVLPSGDLGGPLLPFVPNTGSCNVFCLAPGVEPRTDYLRPYGPVPPLAPSNRGSQDPAERARLTKALMEVKGSDGTRWSDPQELVVGAEARAALVAPHLRPGERVIDLGAGVMLLRKSLPAGCYYLPVDFIPFAANTLVADLNRGPLPEASGDLVVALEVLEYLHDVPAILAWAATAAPRFICSYRCRDGESIEERRAEGWMNDYTETDFAALLEKAGWRIGSRESGADTRLFVCAR